MSSSKESSKASRMFDWLISLSSILSLLLVYFDDDALRRAPATHPRARLRLQQRGAGGGERVTLTNEATGVSSETSAKCQWRIQLPTGCGGNLPDAIRPGGFQDEHRTRHKC